MATIPENGGADSRIRQSWLSVVGLVGIIIAFGHSILAMSGEETLAQVYREVESPKLPNFKKVGLHRVRVQPAADRQHEFLAVMLIPDKERMTTYYDNWMGGLAMHMIGPRVAAASCSTRSWCSSDF